MSTLRVAAVSRWYGDVVAVNNVTMEFGPGITGLLGPNGAGKSTLIHMMSGFLPPSTGQLSLDGQPVWRNEAIYRRIGLVPERESMYDAASGAEFVLANARLHGLPDPAGAARRALATVDLVAAAERPIATYSKGMRQRAKLASALVHDPAVLLLDEPFNGLDPRQRLAFMDLLRALAAAGRCVVFSSHILEEVEAIAERIEVLVAGRHAASGGFREIRRLMTGRPHRYTISSSDDRTLASAIIAERCASSVELAGQPHSPGIKAGSAGGSLVRGSLAAAGWSPVTGATASGPLLHVQVTDVGEFVQLLPRIAGRHGIRLFEVVPADESLESVFSYLVGGHAGGSAA